MATVAEFNQDENQQQQPGGGGQVINSTGSGMPSTGGAGAPSAPRATPSGTPNIRQYIEANQGSGQQLAQGIQSNVQNQANKLNQNVNTSQSQLDSQYQPLQQNLGAGGQQAIQGAFQDPQKLMAAYTASKTQSSNQPLSNDQQNAYNQYQQFQQLNTGGYNPAIDAYGASAQQANQQLQNQYAGLNQQAKAGATEGGRFQLLQNTFGQPNYTPGQQSLDALFLQTQPGVTNQLNQNLNNLSNQANQNIGNLNSDSQAKMAALQGLSQQNQSTIHDMFGGGLNDIAGNVANEYQAAQQNFGQGQQLQSALQNKTGLTPEQLQQLGVAEGTHGWGVDVNNVGHFTPGFLADQANGGYAQAATPEEFARYNALNSLAGGPNGTMQSSIFGTAEQAGGYKPFGFDNAALNKAIEDRKNTITGTDFNNSLNQAILGLRGVGHMGEGSIAPWDLASALQNGQKQGNFTPEQANAMIQQWMPALQSMGTGLGNSVTAVNPFKNYYDQEYMPNFNDIIGQKK